MVSSSADASLQHRLDRILHLLYVAAGVLGIVLLICVAVALWAYRRHGEQEPHA